MIRLLQFWKRLKLFMIRYGACPYLTIMTGIWTLDMPLYRAPACQGMGAITAALFLRRFAGKASNWAHIDVMAWNTASRPGRPKGGEAMGLRALFDLLQGLALNAATANIRAPIQPGYPVLDQPLLPRSPWLLAWRLC